MSCWSPSYGKTIKDERFIRLISGLLKAGYLEDWRWNQTHSGTPQGSIVSPILANLYLDKLDQFVETVLIPEYTKGAKRKPNKEYGKIMSQAAYLSKKGKTDEALKARKEAQKLPSQVLDDPEYRRLRYCRYADDFLLGFIGPKQEAEEIKERLRTFLQEEQKTRAVKSKNFNYACKDGNSEVSKLRDPHDSRGFAARSTGSKELQRKYWAMCSKRCYYKQKSTIYAAQPKSGTSNRTDQRQ